MPERHRIQPKAAAKGQKTPVLEALSLFATKSAGSSWAFALANLTILVWLITGPLFKYSDTWQLVINTGTTVITFLMVFLIQRSQNKESMAIQLKLNEIVAALQGASNLLLNIEDLTEDELRLLHRHYADLATLASNEEDICNSHSVEEAKARHLEKKFEEEQKLDEELEFKGKKRA